MQPAEGGLCGGACCYEMKVWLGSAAGLDIHPSSLVLGAPFSIPHAMSAKARLPWPLAVGKALLEQKSTATRWHLVSVLVSGVLRGNEPPV